MARLGGLLVGDQEIDAIERQAAVVADDAAASVGIGQAGDDAVVAGELHLIAIGIEHAVVVGLAVFEDILDIFR